MKNLNNTLEKISILMHKRTGYSLRQSVLEARDDFEMKADYGHDLFIFNSDEWQNFIELLELACK